MKLLPTTSTQYPIYMTLYWIVIWIVVSIILVNNISKTSKNGVIFKRDCIKEEQNICKIQSRLYSIPEAREAGIQIISAGIIIGGFIMVYGFGQMALLKMKRGK